MEIVVEKMTNDILKQEGLLRDVENTIKYLTSDLLSAQDNKEYLLQLIAELKKAKVVLENVGT